MYDTIPYPVGGNLTANGEPTLFLGTLPCTGLSVVPFFIHPTSQKKNLKQRQFAVPRRKKIAPYYIMSILSGIGQQPPILGTGGSELVYYNDAQVVTNLSNPETTVSAFPPQPILEAGVYLVSFQVIITNLDTAPIDISECTISVSQSASPVGIQQQPEFTLQPTQVYSCIFTVVLYNANTVFNDTYSSIYISVSSGAFATTPPTITTENVSIIKIV